ncbi:MAG: biotin/lipoyl-binding protein, partial [Daejeonella sp.]|nr:biotin/lipoyl-binding protein [Daejeonella sp.]
MKTKYIVYTILVILLAVFVAYRMNKNKAQKAGAGAGHGSELPASVLTVNGIVTKAENFSNSLAIAGTIEANEQVDIRSEVSGLVTEILFNEGSTVSKGKVLLKINDLELQAQLSQALT